MVYEIIGVSVVATLLLITIYQDCQHAQYDF